METEMNYAQSNILHCDDVWSQRRTKPNSSMTAADDQQKPNVTEAPVTSIFVVVVITCQINHIWKYTDTQPWHSTMHTVCPTSLLLQHVCRVTPIQYLTMLYSMSYEIWFGFNQSIANLYSAIRREWITDALWWWLDTINSRLFTTIGQRVPYSKSADTKCFCRQGNEDLVLTFVHNRRNK